MEAQGISLTAGPTLTHLPPKSSLRPWNGFNFSSVIVPSKKNQASINCTRTCVYASKANQNQSSDHDSGLDFNDPDWKSKFQSDLESRFSLPHLTDIFNDAKPIPSTFCLRMRTPLTEEFAAGYPSDEKWHGYINNNDRVLLKRE